VTCPQVRERLTDLALGLLTGPDATEVERHLVWCTACRKEAAELLEGAAQMALAVPQVEPPRSLENRVVNRVQFAAGRIEAPPRRHRAVGLVAATVVAAILALGSVGWAVAEHGNVVVLQNKVDQSNHQVTRLAQVVARLTRQVKGSKNLLATLRPTEASHGSGQAFINTIPRDQALVAVKVFLSTGPGGQPYTAQLIARSGQIFTWRLVSTDIPGEWQVVDNTPDRLENVISITIIDSTSQAVLTGTFAPYTPSA
jgi:hypothetical protein